MSDPRTPVFEAVRKITPPGVFNDPGNMTALHNILDALGAAREGTGLKLGPKGIALIQKWEGYAKDIGGGRVQAYPDPATGGAPWTIGWGSTGADITKGTIWTKAQAQVRFLEHVEQFAADVRKLIGDAPTTQDQFDALVSLAYNVGSDIDADTIAEGLGDSTLLKKHLRGDYAGAAAEFAKWNKAGGRVMAGLTNRRAEEAKLYRGEQ